MSSDWSATIKPVASKTYAELLAAYGEQVGAAIEALEIARRQAEIAQTMDDWAKRHELSPSDSFDLLLDVGKIFTDLCGEFGPQRAVHILVGIEREHNRKLKAQDMKSWRSIFGYSVEAAATELGISSEDVEAIENNCFNAGPAAMALIRPALKRIKSDLTNEKK